MELVCNTRAQRGLDRYVAMITSGIGGADTHSRTEIASPAMAFIELPEPLRLFPSRTAALIWDETYGWAAAIASASGRDWVMVAYLGIEVLPQPAMVVDFAHRLLHGDHAEGPFPPEMAACHDLSHRLAANAS